MKSNILTWLMCSALFLISCVITASARPLPNVKLVLPCHGCSDHKKMQLAENAAYMRGQIIYVADRSPSGNYTVHEYWVDTPGPAMASSSVILRELHSWFSPLSSEIKAADTKISTALDETTGTFIYQNNNFKSAFDAVRMDSSVFGDWLADYHREHFAEQFSVINAEFAKLASKRFGFSFGVFSAGLSEKELLVTHTFSDGTIVKADVDLAMHLKDSHIEMRLKNLNFIDKKGTHIPKTKYGLDRYFDLIGDDIKHLEERGEPRSVSGHFSDLYTPNYVVIEGGNGGGAGGIVRMACSFIKERNTQFVSCEFY
ncbi:hypothetical protein [Pseudoalteromonas sp. S16_S37]|uniref:hypothetical protein n=1 Tax=Pseudoalteromonas sp. S16_S37 TaxID=2720228 RepID=UPI0016819D36|nr:hypothetical protein [Pseudoalteromonas sp. S16_S37]MBD1583600.1 hypothetical protein [Pseudoalteromonas sp. S16_S37]